jgi:hypothetical protein
VKVSGEVIRNGKENGRRPDRRGLPFECPLRQGNVELTPPIKRGRNVEQMW